MPSKTTRTWASVLGIVASIGLGFAGFAGIPIAQAGLTETCPTGSVPVYSGATRSNPLICQLTILTSGEWTPPQTTTTPSIWITSVDIVAVGAGGGGGGGGGTYFKPMAGSYGVTPGDPNYSGGGGGGGEVVRGSLTLSTDPTVTLGVGGTGGSDPIYTSPTYLTDKATDGGDGGTTTIDSITAAGGKGGKAGDHATEPGAGGAAGGASGALGGVGIQGLTGAEFPAQYSAGGGGGGAAGVGADAERATAAYATYTGTDSNTYSPGQDMKAGVGGGRYAFAADSTLWSSSNFATALPSADDGGNSTYFQTAATFFWLGMGGGGGNAVVGTRASGDCATLAAKQGIHAITGIGACWGATTVGGTIQGNSDSVTASGLPYAWKQTYAGAGGSGSVGNRHLNASDGGQGMLLVRFYASGAPIPGAAAATAPVFTAESPTASGTEGTAYSPYAFAASGTRSVFTIESGSLPPGLTLAADGTLSGTPTTTGTYTFTVKACNYAGCVTTASSKTITISANSGGGGTGGGAGGDSGGNSEPAARPTPTPTPTPTASVAKADPLAPITNPNNGNVPTSGLPAGGSLLLVNGLPSSVKVEPNAKQDPTGLDILASSWRMRLVGRGDTSDPLGLTEKMALILQSEQLRTRAKTVQPVAQASGTGFKPTSEVKFYLLPSTYVGSLTTDLSGAFSGTVPVPAGLTPNAYTLQMNGYSPSMDVRSLNLGIVVKASAATAKPATLSVRVLFDSDSSQLSASGKTRLRALVRKTGTTASSIVSIGYVQRAGGSANDKSLSTARARHVAAFLRSLGLKGKYSVRGDGVSGPSSIDRKVVVSVTYRKQ